MNENERNERIVREFLRKIAPPREWEYLGEVEHYWISQLCDELNKQLKAENTELRELVRKWYPHMLKRVGRDALEQWGQMDVVKELGIEVIDG